MKNNNNISDHDELLRLVNRYFEGDTSLAEERNLRRLLAKSSCTDAPVEEARAVMGVFACSRTENRKADVNPNSAFSRLRRSRWTAISAVASVAVLIVAVVSFYRFEKMPNSDSLSAASYCRLSDRHDSLASFDKQRSISAGHFSAARSANGVYSPESPEDVSALINSEMGCMAEAERSMYQSIADDFVSLRVIPK